MSIMNSAKLLTVDLSQFFFVWLIHIYSYIVTNLVSEVLTEYFDQ